MPASQRAPATRRPILRFDLASVSIDDRPNVYKNPQLVLKPQLELAPHRPFTGSRPRVPVWRHFLMVHVKDKADELVKLDLAIIKPPSADADSVTRPTVSCLCSRNCLVFKYQNSIVKESSTLSATLQTTSDVETVLRELSELNINVEHEQGIQGHSLASGVTVHGSWAPPGLSLSSVYPPPSNPRQLNSSSPPLIPGLQGRHPPYPEGHPHGTVLHRPPSQPIGQSGLQTGQRPWSPAFVPSRPATTLGVPGVLGEGIYKVSKIGSTASSRPKVRRTATLLEHQGPRLYTVSKHFDRTLSTADILHSSGARHLGRGLSTGLELGNSADYISRSPSLGTPGTESQYNPRQEHPATQPLTRMPSALEGVPVNTHHQPRLRRLRTINDALNPSLTAGFVDDKGRPSFLSSVAEENAGFSFSQPQPASRAGGHVDDASFFSSSPTLLEPSSNQEMGDDWLFQVSQVQHQGLCEANRIWDELMERADTDVASAESSRDLFELLSKYEGEFARRWEGVVAGTVQKMRGVRAGGYV